LEYSLYDSGAAVLFINKQILPRCKKLPPLENLTAVAVTDGVQGQSDSAFAETSDWSSLLQAIPSQIESRFPYRAECDLAQIIYTSGTTGKPKGVMLRHSNLVANSQSIISYLELTDNDRGMAVLPFFYSYGNSVLLSHLLVGASLVVNQSFMYPNLILDQMIKHEVTGFSGVPSMFALLLNRSAVSQYSFPKLRYLTQAGAAMSPTLARRVQKVFPTARIYVMYGQTEAAARLAYLDPDCIEERAGSIGKAIPGVNLRLLDGNAKPVVPGETGEIVARGSNIMAGYWKKPQETKEVLTGEGLWTGDLAYQDDDGYFYIVSRKGDIIKSGGHRIGPQEIEDVLYEHPAVHEVAVVGIADEILDERIRACVVLKDGGNCDIKELLKHCRKDLPAYKVPHEIVFLEQLPKTATGKIKKIELRVL
jgi:acyl-CoA synthetase (AMP-forming)/AMP-acid ligase II